MALGRLLAKELHICATVPLLTHLLAFAEAKREDWGTQAKAPLLMGC